MHSRHFREQILTRSDCWQHRDTAGNTVTPEVGDPISRRVTFQLRSLRITVQAYDYLLQGNLFYRTLTRAGITKRREFFRKAAASDPTNGDAYALIDGPIFTRHTGAGPPTTASFKLARRSWRNAPYFG